MLPLRALQESVIFLPVLDVQHSDVLQSCRSPWKRLVEVVLLVLVTSSLWFAVAYSSPCRELPGKVQFPHFLAAAIEHKKLANEQSGYLPFNAA